MGSLYQKLIFFQKMSNLGCVLSKPVQLKQIINWGLSRRSSWSSVCDFSGKNSVFSAI